MTKLCSLHTNTEYSFGESTIRIDSLISFAKEKGLESLVITDHNNLHGAYEFYTKCKKNNIKPIIGLDLDVQDFRFILLAKNYDGFKELARLSSMKLNGLEININDIQSINLFVIDHPTKGYFLKTKQMPSIENFFISSEKDFPNSVFVSETKILYEVENEAISILESANESSITWKKYKPYIYEQDENVSSVRQAISIADNCNLEFPEKSNHLPKFKNDFGLSSKDFFKKILQEKFKELFPSMDAVYLERLKYEVSIVNKLGFEDYFLIIWDFIKWAKSQNIAIGPGRGSAAGSLISYVLGITEIDPIKYELLFERFLNPERVTMPDIDIDIQDSRRDEVVNYLFEKYGHSHVAHITTFSRLGAKSALRDVARVMGIPVRDVNTLSKLVMSDLTLEEAYKQSSRFRATVNSSETYTNLFKWSKSIEGLPRQIGTHAAGVIISSTPLSKEFPILKNSEGLNQIQYSMEHLEVNGLLKIDLLGLKNLTILQDIQEQVWKSYKRKVDLKKIPDSDKLTNDLLSSGDTNGIFQLESYGMKDTLTKVGASSLEDVVAIISLYRPGPMESIPTYAARKANKESWDKVNDVFDKITSKTYGIIIYQEQIMQLSQEFAGMSFGQADILRRAISKKNPSEIEKMKEIFVKGAIAKGYEPEQIEKIYSLIERFADYGFNRSHAVAYGLLAYRMAYLKARFKLEFYTALLQASQGSQDATKKYVQEAKTNNIEVIPPTINSSEKIVFTSEKKIFMPLGIIKGFGQVAEDKVIIERLKGKFIDFFDAVSRLKIAGLGSAAIRLLIQANAMREFGNMQTLLDALPSAERYAELITIEKDGIKVLDPFIPKPNLAIQKQNVSEEIDAEIGAFGFLMNIFPTSGFEIHDKIMSIKKGESKEVVVHYASARVFKDKNGNEYAVASVSDSTTSIDLTIFVNEWKFVSTTKRNSIVKAIITLKEFNNKASYNLVKPWKEVQ